MAKSNVFDLFRLDQDEEEELLNPEQKSSKSNRDEKSPFSKGSFSHNQKAEPSHPQSVASSKDKHSETKDPLQSLLQNDNEEAKAVAKLEELYQEGLYQEGLYQEDPLSANKQNSFAVDPAEELLQEEIRDQYNRPITSSLDSNCPPTYKQASKAGYHIKTAEQTSPLLTKDKALSLLKTTTSNNIESSSTEKTTSQVDNSQVTSSQGSLIEEDDEAIILNLPSDLVDDLDKDLEEILSHNFTESKEQPAKASATAEELEELDEDSIDPLEEVLFYTPRVNINPEEVEAREEKTQSPLAFNASEDSLEAKLIDDQKLTDSSTDSTEFKFATQAINNNELSQQQQPQVFSQDTEKIASQDNLVSKKEKSNTITHTALPSKPKKAPTTSSVISPPMASFISNKPSISSFGEELDKQKELSASFNKETKIASEYIEDTQSSAKNYKVSDSKESPKKYPFLPPKVKAKPFKVAEKKPNLGKDEAREQINKDHNIGYDNDHSLGSTVSKKLTDTLKKTEENLEASSKHQEEIGFRNKKLDSINKVNFNNSTLIPPSLPPALQKAQAQIAETNPEDSSSPNKIAEDKNNKATKDYQALTGELKSIEVEGITSSRQAKSFTIEHQQLAPSKSQSSPPLLHSTLGGAANFAKGLASLAQQQSLDKEQKRSFKNLALDNDDEIVDKVDKDHSSISDFKDSIQGDLEEEANIDLPQDPINLDTSFAHEYVKAEEDPDPDFDNGYYQDYDTEVEQTIKLNDPNDLDSNANDQILDDGDPDIIDVDIKAVNAPDSSDNIDPDDSLVVENNASGFEFSNSDNIDIDIDSINMDAVTIDDIDLDNPSNDSADDNHASEAEASDLDQERNNNLKKSDIEYVSRDDLDDDIYDLTHYNENTGVIPELKNTATVKLASFKYEVSHSGKEVVDAQPSLLSPVNPTSKIEAKADLDYNDNEDIQDLEDQLYDQDSLSLDLEDIDIVDLDASQTNSLEVDQVTKNLLHSLSELEDTEPSTSKAKNSNSNTIVDLTADEEENPTASASSTETSAQEALLAALAKAKTDLSNTEKSQSSRASHDSKTSQGSPVSFKAQDPIAQTKVEVEQKAIKVSKTLAEPNSNSQLDQELYKQSKEVQNSLVKEISKQKDNHLEQNNLATQKIAVTQHPENQDLSKSSLPRGDTSSRNLVPNDLASTDLVANNLETNTLSSNTLAPHDVGSNSSTKPNTKELPPLSSHSKSQTSIKEETRETLMDFSIFAMHPEEEVEQSSLTNQETSLAEKESLSLANKKDQLASFTPTNPPLRTKPSKQEKPQKKNLFSLFNKEDKEDFNPTDIFALK